MNYQKLTQNPRFVFKAEIIQTPNDFVNAGHGCLRNIDLIHKRQKRHLESGKKRPKTLLHCYRRADRVKECLTNKTASDTLSEQQLETIAWALFERLTNSHSSRLECSIDGISTTNQISVKVVESDDKSSLQYLFQISIALSSQLIQVGLFRQIQQWTSLSDTNRLR